MRPLAQTPCLRGEAQGLETERDRRPLPLCRTWEDKGAEPRSAKALPSVGGTWGAAQGAGRQITCVC